MHAEMPDENPNGSNRSSNPALADMVEKRLSRRSVLQGAATLTAAQFLAGGVSARGAFAAPARGRSGPLIGFTEAPPSDADTVVVPPGYTWEAFQPWGTPLFPGAPAFEEDASNSAADQELQVGFNHDGMHYFPLGVSLFGNRRGLLVLNHEYTDARQIYTAVQGSAITPDAQGKERSPRPWRATASRSRTSTSLSTGSGSSRPPRPSTAA